MKIILTFLIFSCIFQKSEAKFSYSNSIRQSTQILLIGNFSIATFTDNGRPVFKKNKFRSLLFKFKKNENEDTAKRKNRLLGKFSTGFGILSLIFMLLTFIFESGFTILAWFILPLIAIILGVIALGRSKKFSDKINSGRKEAITGIILGSLGLAAFIIWTIIELSGFS